MQTVLTHYGGWHSGATGDDGFLNHVCHSGDGETHTGCGEIFEHPTKTWACATHKQFTMQAVAVAIAKGPGSSASNDKPQKLCVPPVGVNTAAVVEPTFDCRQKYNAALGQIPTDTGFITGKRLHPQ